MLYIYMGEETGERNRAPVRAPPRRDSIRKGIMGRILSSKEKILLYQEHKSEDLCACIDE